MRTGYRAAGVGWRAVTVVVAAMVACMSCVERQLTHAGVGWKARNRRRWDWLSSGDPVVVVS